MSDQTNDADAIPDGWNIGDTRPCGCEVVPVSVACEFHFHGHEWQVAQADCGACEYGMPGVRHWTNDTCAGGDD
jgi:hypothetical protein